MSRQGYGNTTVLEANGVRLFRCVCLLFCATQLSSATLGQSPGICPKKKKTLASKSLGNARKNCSHRRRNFFDASTFLPPPTSTTKISILLDIADSSRRSLVPSVRKFPSNYRAQSLKTVPVKKRPHYPNQGHCIAPVILPLLHFNHGFRR